MREKRVSQFPASVAKCRRPQAAVCGPLFAPRGAGTKSAFAAVTDAPKDAVRLQAGETVDYRWVDRAELEGILDSADMVTHVRSGYYACVEKGLIE